MDTSRLNINADMAHHNMSFAAPVKPPKKYSRWPSLAEIQQLKRRQDLEKIEVSPFTNADLSSSVQRFPYKFALD